MLFVLPECLTTAIIHDVASSDPMIFTFSEKEKNQKLEAITEQIYTITNRIHGCGRVQYSQQRGAYVCKHCSYTTIHTSPSSRD